MTLSDIVLDLIIRWFNSKLLGEAPKGAYQFHTDDGALGDPSEAVFPILSQDAKGIFSLIGTGFFIAENGIFVTAAHVISAVLDEHDNPTGPLGLFQFSPGGKYYPRPIHCATRHPVADVAVGVAWPMHHNQTGHPLPNKLLSLSTSAPGLGTVVSTYAYPKTTIQRGSPQVIHFEPAFFDGQVVEHFPNGRDRAVLPGACFQTSMVIHGGASGGPVLGPNGAVFGVNSTGFENEAVSFVSCISQILELGIPDVVVPGSHRPRLVTVRELCEMKFVLSK
jgi:hypothetical protein